VTSVGAIRLTIVGAISLTTVGAILLTIVGAILLTCRCDPADGVGAKWFQTGLSVRWVLAGADSGYTLGSSKEWPMLKEFREFISRGNVVDLAVGVIIGAAFGRIVTTLVEGVIMPPIGLVLGRIDFSSLFLVLDGTKGVPVSLADAKAKGVPVIAFGQFLNDIVSFLIVALAVFILVKQVNRLKTSLEKPAAAAAPVTTECPFCFESISVRAKRCPRCTSQLGSGGGAVEMTV
jgi:large conductance mechanosensitive channel